MSKRHNRSSKTRNVVRREERVEATPETKAKLEGDWRLDLSPDHQIAAVRIRGAYELITADVRCAAQDLLRLDKGKAHTEGEHERRLQAEYNDWVDACSGHRMPIYALIDVLCDALSYKRRIAETVTYICPTGKGACVMFGQVEAALEIYCRIMQKKAA